MLSKPANDHPLPDPVFLMPWCPDALMQFNPSASPPRALWHCDKLLSRVTACYQAEQGRRSRVNLFAWNIHRTLMGSPSLLIVSCTVLSNSDCNDIFMLGPVGHVFDIMHEPLDLENQPQRNLPNSCRIAVELHVNHFRHDLHFPWSRGMKVCTQVASGCTSHGVQTSHCCSQAVA